MFTPVDPTITRTVTAIRRTSVLKYVKVPKHKVLCLATLLALLILGVALYFILNNEGPVKNETMNDEPMSDSTRYHRHAIVSNGFECASIGMKMLTEQNGTAVDAAIATLFCEGVTASESMGLGGGFVATIYQKSSGKIETLISREQAPLAATENMFENMTSVKGILSVAVPGELKGYAELHTKYGRVPWKILIQPTIDLCRSGHIVTEFFARVLHSKRENIYKEPSMSEIFVNPETNEVWKAGDRIRRLKLAETLEIIAEEGVDTMYTANGTIAKLLVEDIQELGGIITIEDLVNFKAEWKSSISTKLGEKYTLHSVPLPGSGMVLALILNMLSGFRPSNSADYYHEMIESFKYAYAKRTFLGDLPFNQSFIDQYSDMKYADELRANISIDKTYNDFRHYGPEYAIKEDHGTAHISILSENGDAVSITSTINHILGSHIRSQSTGIILNNQMDDFSTPGISNGFDLEPSPANFIKPGKRPLSSMCPIIVLDDNDDAIFVGGSAGGSRITTTTSHIIAQHFWLNTTLEEAIKSKRYHHQLVPMEIVHEDKSDIQILDGLRQKGHKMIEEIPKTYFSAATAISRARGFVEVAYDPRRSGSFEIH